MKDNLTKAEIIALFKQFDHNFDGLISEEELMIMFGEYFPREHLKTLIKKVDTNGDGKVSIEG
jgi:Ca2+-binding EF-hand superfamily protein